MSYEKHFCSLEEAKYIVVAFRELIYDYPNRDDIICFKDEKYAKKCFANHKVGTGFPEITHCRLLKVEDVK